METQPKKRGAFYIIAPVLIYLLITYAVSTVFSVVLLTSNSAMLSQITNTDILLEELMKLISSQYYNITFVTSAVMITVFSIMFFRKERNAFDKKFANEITFKGIFMMIGLAIGTFMLVNILLTILASLPMFEQTMNSYDSQMELIFNNNLLFDILTVGILAPIQEELLFRGLVFNRLRIISQSEKTSAIYCALFFSMMHFGSIIQMAYAFGLGYLLCITYTKFENILAPILVHVIFNMSNFILINSVVDNALTTMIGVSVFYALGVSIFTISINALKRKAKVDLKTQ